MTDQNITFTVEVEGMPVPEVKWYVLQCQPLLSLYLSVAWFAEDWI
jgi:hypothetical protein